MHATNGFPDTTVRNNDRIIVIGMLGRGEVLKGHEMWLLKKKRIDFIKFNRTYSS